ncbi:TIGR00341 family protein [Natronococcus sp. A-GB1]|uniref:TIGR00341 family protein n=1 Tax=Natronococcus sp. A-GB1 TaxID=3037648 RepID=UPI00241DD80A|nr:TIGR00341 family protein [Natronococcus sp. A-GB1]MDG5761378.1 TIGR00341 family protein [Natronococcus sp. A-GB1]
MRYVEVMIPPGRQATVLEILEDEDLDYVVTDETSGRGYVAVVRFPLPSDAVERVLDQLTDAGISEDASIVVIDARTVLSEDVARLKTRSGHGAATGGRISRQELETRASELTPSFLVYATMTFISAIVATSGLLLDSPAVVVGSMVIAPLIGPALAASIGFVVADADLRRTGLAYQFGGLGIAILGAVLLAGLVRIAGIEPAGVDVVAIAELEERVAPNLLALVVALGAGIAGILSLTRELSEAIVGVMIAAALIPPAAAVGIAIAWQLPGAAVGALILTLVNALSINLAALVTLWSGGYRPTGLFSLTAARRQTIVFVTVLGAVMLLLVVPLVSATVVEFRAAELESDAEASVADVLAAPAYETVDARTVTVELDDDYPIRSIDAIVVTVTGPERDLDPPLSDRLVAAIEPHVDEPIDVRIQQVTTHSETLPNDGDPGNASSGASLRVDTSACRTE